MPHCYGWLALDARGDWYMRDDRIQAAGPFPQVKGSRIEHEKLREFIEPQLRPRRRRLLVLPERAAARLCRARGRALGLAAGADGDVERESPATPARRRVPIGLARRNGRLFLATDLGFGMVHTLDMDPAADAVERGLWAPEPVAFDELPRASAIALRADAAADAAQRRRTRSRPRTRRPGACPWPSASQAVAGATPPLVFRRWM